MALNSWPTTRLSKAIDGGQVAGQFGTFFGTDPPIDPLNRKLEYGDIGSGPAASLRRQRGVGAAFQQHPEPAAPR